MPKAILEIKPRTHTANEILNSIARLENLLKEPVVIFDFLRVSEMQDRLLAICVCLNDLLQKADDAGLRVDFTDEIRTGIGVRDVTDLINKARNAMSHISSKEHYVGNHKISFNFGTWTDGDSYFAFGKYHVLEQRHIRESFRIVRERLTPLITEPD